MKSRRATHRELSKWLAQGKGEVTEGDTSNFPYCKTSLYYDSGKSDKPCGYTISIRKWKDDEWHEPTIDYMGIEEARQYMKFRIFKHITKFVAKNDNYIEEDFPGGPHIRMRLYVRVLPFIYLKTGCTFLHNMKLRLHQSDLQRMVDLYYAGGRTDG